MEDNSILAKISSKYVFQNIFDYIKDSKFKLRLFNYSKYFQKMLDIDIIDYESEYISNFDMTLEDFLYKKMDITNFDKDSLKNIFDEKIKQNNLDANLIKKIVYDYFKKLENKKVNKDYYLPNYFISIFSPLLDTISKTSFFQVLTFEVQWDIIEKFNLQNDYREIFDKLNKMNANYSLLSFEISKFDQLPKLNELNIDLNKIKSLLIRQKEKQLLSSDKDNIENNENEDNNNTSEEDSVNLGVFYNIFFSMNESFKNLLYLRISTTETEEIIEPSCFENLNKFQSLKHLVLENLKFKEPYIFQLKNVEIIDLYQCDNISFDQCFCDKIIEFFLNFCDLKKPECKLNFPKLQIYEYEWCNINLNEFINFSSLKSLKRLNCEVEDFLSLEEIYSLEEIHLNNDETISFQKEKKMFEKILSLESLDKAEFYIHQLDDKEMSYIKGENKSITELKLHWPNESKDFILFNPKKNFLNKKNYT